MLGFDALGRLALGEIPAPAGTAHELSLETAVSCSGSLSRSVGKIIAPLVSASVTIPRNITKAILVVCSVPVFINKAITRDLGSAGVSVAGAVVKSVAVDVGTAAVSAAASMRKSVGKLVLPVVSAAGSIKRDIAKTVLVGVSVSAIVGKGFALTLAGKVGTAVRIYPILGLRKRIAKIIVSFSSFFATGVASAGRGDFTMTSAAAVGSAEVRKAISEVDSPVNSVEIDAAN